MLKTNSPPQGMKIEMKEKGTEMQIVIKKLSVKKTANKQKQNLQVTSVNKPSEKNVNSKTNILCKLN